MTFGEKWRKDLLNKWIQKPDVSGTRYLFFTRLRVGNHKSVPLGYDGYTYLIGSNGKTIKNISYIENYDHALYHYTKAKVVTNRRMLKRLNRLKLKKMLKDAQAPLDELA